LLEKSNLNLLKDLPPTHNLRLITFMWKDITAEEKHKFMKVGICFYCSDKGNIVKEYLKNLG
jgi:hypothetical protein